jgi:triacylglycerol lipase
MSPPGDRLPLWLSLLDTLKLPNSGDGTAFEALCTDVMKTFNEEVPDDPNVKYFSWGATFQPGLLDTFRWPYR